MNLLSGRGQPCPRDSSQRNSRTRLSALLSVAGSWPQLASKFWRCSLPMNRKVACLHCNDLCNSGSWAVSRSERNTELSMTPPHPVPLPLRGGESARRARERDVHSSDERLENRGNSP